MNERIKFQIQLSSLFWDRPPHVKISVDDVEYYHGDITKLTTVNFSVTVDFDVEHSLIIQRSGKTPDQTKITQGLDQVLYIDSLAIDSTQIDSLLHTHSVFTPDYPEPWASQQRALGMPLAETIVGENILGHNGMWCLKFTSPFYQYLFTTV